VIWAGQSFTGLSQGIIPKKVNKHFQCDRAEGHQKIYRIGEAEYPMRKGINLNVEPCEFIALIMGPFGSCKSTLLNIVSCLDRAAGQFILLDQDISQTSDEELARRDGRS